MKDDIKRRNQNQTHRIMGTVVLSLVSITNAAAPTSILLPWAILIIQVCILKYVLKHFKDSIKWQKWKKKHGLYGTGYFFLIPDGGRSLKKVRWLKYGPFQDPSYYCPCCWEIKKKEWEL